MSENVLIHEAVRTEPDYAKAKERLQSEDLIRLLHVAMGLCTEAGEFADNIKKHIFYGKPVDETNLQEEAGDITWYLDVFCDRTETTLKAIREMNRAKLKVRFPDKFTEQAAVNRDLSGENDKMNTFIDKTKALKKVWIIPDWARGE